MWTGRKLGKWIGVPHTSVLRVGLLPLSVYIRLLSLLVLDSSAREIDGRGGWPGRKLGDEPGWPTRRFYVWGFDFPTPFRSLTKLSQSTFTLLALRNEGAPKGQPPQTPRLPRVSFE